MPTPQRNSARFASFFGFGKGSSCQPAPHGSFSQVQKLRDLLGLPPLRVQFHDLLRARRSPSSSSQSYFLHMSRLGRTPLCDGDDLPVRLASLWLFRFACRYDFCLTARQEELRCLGQIFHERESIGALKRLGSALRCRFCILPPRSRLTTVISGRCRIHGTAGVAMNG